MHTPFVHTVKSKAAGDLAGNLFFPAFVKCLPSQVCFSFVRVGKRQIEDRKENVSTPISTSLHAVQCLLEAAERLPTADAPRRAMEARINAAAAPAAGSQRAAENFLRFDFEIWRRSAIYLKYVLQLMPLLT